MTKRPICDICQKIEYDERDPHQEVTGIPLINHLCLGCYQKIMKIVGDMIEKEGEQK